MSDTSTWRENAIVQAIQIIADKKIAQAGFDKTIKGVINKVLDKTTGKYQIKYQDSLFEAYATSAKIEYVKDQQVSILIPGNDWDRVKTILGAVDGVATNYQQIPIAGQQYNNLGPNGSSLSGNIELSSYVDSVIDLGSYLTIRSDLANYIKKGDSIALGMVVRTALAGTQVGGNYGLTFRLRFKDNVTGNQTIKTFNVDTSDVLGHPYQLTSDTLVEALIKNVDTQNFIGIDSIQAFCDGFPLDESKVDIKDIIISDVRINGASALTEDELNGYVLHIDDSENGNILRENANQPLLLKAVLKVNGKATTENVVYYWFRQNGTIFRGNVGKYSGYAGDGWECLNVYASGAFVPKTKNTFTFNINEDDLNNDSALAVQRVNKILCVAVYDNKQWIKGEIEIINMNINNNFYISTKQKIDAIKEDEPTKTIYYLDNGTPTLICNIQGLEVLDNDQVEYIWSVKPARGKSEKKQVTTDLNNQYAAVVAQWKRVQTRANNMAVVSAEEYKESAEYTNAKENFKLIQFRQRIQGNQYINFPIKNIQNYSTISCAVMQNGSYKGTASITLYNKTQLEGMYSLNLEHGTQVFQYDGKGNSPTSPQIEKPLELQSLTFTLIDNEGKQITHEQIRNNGHIKWIIPNKQTLLRSNEQDGTPGQLDLTVLRADLPLAADDYTVYFNLDSFSYSIADQYDLKCNINYIWLNVKFKDIVLDAYTNFTFPKDGDPGTNGTDFVAKLIPALNDDSKLQTDRVYVDSNGVKYIDNGNAFDKLIFSLYNNSKEINNNVDFWTCPPKTSYDQNHTDTNNANHYINVNSSGIISGNNGITPTVSSFLEHKPVDIVRAQQGTGNEQKYFAEYPVCYNFISSENYRFKVRPKTGFKYVVYAEDATSPNYDNTMPFEIIVQKLDDDNYYEVQSANNYEYEWYVIGQQLELDNKQNINNNISVTLSVNTNTPVSNNSNKAFFKPIDKLDSSILTNAIVVRIKEDNNYIGYIHIPIYMIVNRFGHSAINAWDGTSVQLGKENGVILAPQVGTGSKNSNNQFSGVLMGDIKTGNKTEQGLFGYNNGERSIFLDAETGNATFGKSGAAQIKIIASSGEGTIQSGDYSYSTSNHNGKGLKIKFSSTGTGTEQGPYIRYGSNKFSVSADGSIHAAGSGDIAGWNITDTRLYKNNTGMASSGLTTNDIGGSLPNTTASVAFHAGTSSAKNNFYVTHDGYLFSKSGKIANWNIDAYRLSQNKVGLNAPASINDNTVAIYAGSTSSTLTNNPFYVTYGGYLRSTSGKIAGWSIALDDNKDNLENGNVGLGTYVTNITGVYPGDVATSKGKVTAKIWSGSGNQPNFAVSNNGYIYSKAGRIGGWTITDTQLAGGNTVINSGGSLSNSGGNNGTWAINNDGSASFTNINASGGNIGNYIISDGQLSNGNVTLTSLGTLEATGGHIGAVSIDNTGLHGTGFDITNSFAKFTGLYVDDTNNVKTSNSGGISSSGGNWGLSSGGGSVGGCPFGDKSTTGNLAVDTLEVDKKAVTWKQLNCVSNIVLKKAINVFSAPTVEPTYTISGSITVPGYSFSVDGTVVNLPERTVDCSGLTVNTSATWHDFKAPVQGLSFSHYTAQILGASNEQTDDLD